MGRFSRLQSFANVQAPRFVRHPDRSYRCLCPPYTGQPWLLLPSISRVVTFSCFGYTNRPNRVIDGMGTCTPLDCSLVGCSANLFASSHAVAHSIPDQHLSQALPLSTHHINVRLTWPPVFWRPWSDFLVRLFLVFFYLFCALNCTVATYSPVCGPVSSRRFASGRAFFSGF